MSSKEDHRVKGHGSIPKTVILVLIQHHSQGSDHLGLVTLVVHGCTVHAVTSGGRVNATMATYTPESVSNTIPADVSIRAGDAACKGV